MGSYGYIFLLPVGSLGIAAICVTENMSGIFERCQSLPKFLPMCETLSNLIFAFLAITEWQQRKIWSGRTVLNFAMLGRVPGHVMCRANHVFPVKMVSHWNFFVQNSWKGKCLEIDGGLVEHLAANFYPGWNRPFIWPKGKCSMITWVRPVSLWAWKLDCQSWLCMARGRCNDPALSMEPGVEDPLKIWHSSAHIPLNGGARRPKLCCGVLCWPKDTIVEHREDSMVSCVLLNTTVASLATFSCRELE